MSESKARPRGRPSATSGYAPVTRESIAEKALAIAGAEGFSAVTMKRLAEELDVTVRALYNHVTDRQDVIDLAAGALIDKLPIHVFDPDDWQKSVRQMYTSLRNAYRQFPRATLVSLDETLTPGRVSEERLREPERMLKFFTTIGLTLDDALIMRSQFLIDVFGHLLLVDYQADSAAKPEQFSTNAPVPRPWLEAQPDHAHGRTQRAMQLPHRDTNAHFERMIERAVVMIEHCLTVSSS